MANEERKDWVGFNSGSETINGLEQSTVSTEVSNNEENSKVFAKIDVSSHEEKSTKRSNGKTARVTPTSNDAPPNEMVFGVSETTAGARITGENVEGKMLKTGKLLTSVFPTNEHCAWVSLPEYDAAKMPKILLHEQIALPASVYISAMKTITQDIRFLSYCVMYSRVLPVWVLASVIVLLIILFSSPSGGFSVVVLAFIWMFMLLLGILFCIIIRKHLAISLKQSVKDANCLTLPRNLLVGVQDRGQLSCHKVVILFVYYEIGGCQNEVARLLQIYNANNLNPAVSKAIHQLAGLSNRRASMLDANGRLIASKAMELAYQLILDYSQQYVKAYMKKQLLFPTRPLEGVSDFRPKHCAKSYCICQYIEREFFNRKADRPWYENLI